MYSPRIAPLVLSRGSTWNPIPWEPPYLLADHGTLWPTGATAQAVFYDSSGGVLATVNGTVAPDKITFTASPAMMDTIPAGANYEIFLTVSGAPYQIRYGKVIRKEAWFTQPPPDIAATALTFQDTWPTTGLRSSWIPILGSTVVHNNSGASLPNGVGSPYILVGQSANAIRWFEPLATSSPKVKISMLDQHSFLPLGFAHCTVLLCADASLTSFLGVDFFLNANALSQHQGQIRFCTANGAPNALVFQGNAITHLVQDGNDYTISYDDATATLSVYQGANLTPLGSWQDYSRDVPQGPGYTYLGLAWQTSQLTNGLQVTTWQAMDSL
ncbi:MAG: hypothetical protein K2Q25_11895 [Mycobacteriaceae bacterium]|nr:hypothetical protein [Mycobacteriaceae bacterium]